MTPSRPSRLALFVVLTSMVAGGTAASRPDLPVVSDEALDAVFLVGVVNPEGSFTEVGTAWTIAENRLATNAHVAAALLEEVGEGRMVARRGLLDPNELVLDNVVLHPAYNTWNPRMERMLVGAASQLKELSMIAVADVALLDVVVGDAGTPLKCVDVSDPVSEPRLGDDVMYLGFPAENLSGFTTLHGVPGNITAKTDFFFLRSGWADAHLLHFAGPATGGASGSPLLDGSGRVLGILSAAEHLLLNEDSGTRASFGFSYAQRIDLAVELLDGSVAQVQAERDRRWAEQAYDLFAKPGDIIEGLIELRGEWLGVSKGSFRTVAKRQETLTDEATETSIRVIMEPGYSYGFFAVAHDATDVDIVIRDRDGTDLAEDVETDHYPVVWLDEVDSRTEVFMVVESYEELLQATSITTRVVRVDASLITTSDSDLPEWLATPLGERIVDQQYTITTDGQQWQDFTLQAEPGFQYTFRAVSVDQLDVDLRVYLGDTLLGEDVLVDWYPEVQVMDVSGELRIEMAIPGNAVAGQTIQYTADILDLRPAEMD